MAKMKLIAPSMEYDRQIQDFRTEYLASGESMDGGASLRKYGNTKDWLDSLEPDTSQYIYMDEEGKMVGILQLRHKFNDFLRKYAGHIGYAVRPSERRKGYASEMLAGVLPRCRELGIYDVLVTCLAENEGSRRTILKNGGVYESTVFEPESKSTIERYWIRLEK